IDQDSDTDRDRSETTEIPLQVDRNRH
ncbi:unnamed protein product, partial [Rotaria magnacalcarata]